MCSQQPVKATDIDTGMLTVLQQPIKAIDVHIGVLILLQTQPTRERNAKCCSKCDSQSKPLPGRLPAQFFGQRLLGSLQRDPNIRQLSTDPKYSQRRATWVKYSQGEKTKQKTDYYGMEAILLRLLKATGIRSISLFVPKIAKRSCLILLYSLVWHHSPSPPPSPTPSAPHPHLHPVCENLCGETKVKETGLRHLRQLHGLVNGFETDQRCV